MPVLVSALFVYPIKSCGGIAVPAAEVARRGLARDRRWMVVDEEGVFLTQRSVPQMARVRPLLDDDALRLRAAGHPELSLPAALAEGARRAVAVWDSRVEALVHEAGSGWFSAVLGVRCRLVYLPDDVHRPTDPAWARPGDEVSFADGFPFLLISEGSLDALNARLPAPLSMARFRPNIVVTGCAPFAEDGWARLHIGAVAFRGLKPCDRCVMTTVDPETGERAGPEPLATLATFRGRAGKVWFGMNLVHDELGTVRVGDPVTVEQTGPVPFSSC